MKKWRKEAAALKKAYSEKYGGLTPPFGYAKAQAKKYAKFKAISRPPSTFYQMLVHSGIAHVITDEEIVDAVFPQDFKAPIASDLDSRAVYSVLGDGRQDNAE